LFVPVLWLNTIRPVMNFTADPGTMDLWIIMASLLTLVATYVGSLLLALVKNNSCSIQTSRFILAPVQIARTLEISSMQSLTRILVIIVATSLLTACATTSSEPQSLEAQLAEKGYTIGPSVDRIQQFRVNGWNYLDREHVIVTVDASRRYLVSLRISCHGLTSAEVIAFTNTVSYLTTFDQLLVRDNGRMLERCPIKSMNELIREKSTDVA
jgi:hypothetical protein